MFLHWQLCNTFKLLYFLLNVAPMLMILILNYVQLKTYLHTIKVCISYKLPSQVHVTSWIHYFSPTTSRCMFSVLRTSVYTTIIYFVPIITPMLFLQAYRYHIEQSNILEPEIETEEWRPGCMDNKKYHSKALILI